MKITFWGVRGSIPTPSTPNFSTVKYGGNTTCFQIQSGNLMVILDGGSGMRLLGLDLLKRMPVRAKILFSHVHWDHIQGFPFFTPAFIKGNDFDMYGPILHNMKDAVGTALETTLRGQQNEINFPAQLDHMQSRLNFTDLKEGQTIRWDASDAFLLITPYMLNHPGGCFGYRIEEHSEGENGAEKVKVLSICADTEHLPELNPNVQTLAKNADLLIYDGQYTDEEYEGKSGPSRKTWGHSTYTYGLKEALAANARRVVITHHDPTHDDAFIDAMEETAARLAAKSGIILSFARETQTLTV
ncbi:MAG: MBL fold metallo-hydrolase [Planctomycetota bacterium]